jgi:general secretion pathway protein K
MSRQHRGEMTNRTAQRGVALIKAMLVVALATSVAVAMVSRQQFDIRRTGNVLQAGQAALYTDGVEAWAAQLLRRDRLDNQVDHAEEDWATILPPIPVEGGSISGAIEDLQGRFNLNSLVVAGKAEPKAVARFKRLLEALRSLNLDQAAKLTPELAAVVIDWLDPDQDLTFPGGAEDDIYMNRERPYRSANGPMFSPSELLLLQGVDAEVYALLRPHVATLPVEAKLNVNTATIPVLMSLAQGVTDSDAESLIEDRPYDNKKDFEAHTVLAGRKLDKDILTIETEHFLIVSQVEYGSLTQQRYSVLQRDAKGEGRILMRAQGTY